MNMRDATLRPFPTALEYNLAIQNCHACFRVPELQRASSLIISRLGLPLPAAAGRFAQVYRLTDGQQEWAIRCFMHDRGPLRDRHYSAITEHLSAVQLDCLVPFRYHQEGIRVNGQWYPLVQMQWVDGQPLDEYVAAHLNQPHRLRRIARLWLALLRRLAARRVAHSDLQHGNVLVQNDRLMLIDYDALCVPALEGKRTAELGHRNYQHPLPTKQTYSLQADHFPGWIIYISLLALSEAPDLWDRYDGERLIFGEDDLKRPGETEVWRRLQACSPAVAGHAARLATFLQTDPANIPSPAPSGFAGWLLQLLAPSAS
jgi:hypothetical protein